MPSTSPELIEIATRHQVFYERLKTHEANAFGDFMVRLDEDLRKQLSRSDLTELTRAKFNKQLVSVREIINATYSDYKETWQSQLIDAGSYEAEFEKKALDQVVVNYDFDLPGENQIKSAIFGRPLSVEGIYQGALLDDFFDDIADKTRQRIENSIRMGYVQGQTNQQVINNIFGTRPRRMSDGLLALSQRDAEIIARTSLQHVASQAREEVWQRNSDIVRKVRIVATLDSRTSTICRSLSGQEYPIDKGPRPPFHLSCRSAVVGVLDDRFKVLDKGAQRVARNPDGKIVRVDANLTYYDWLKTQSAKFQNEVIGAKRGKLLREGGLSAQRFSELQLGKRFEPLSLNEMRELEPLAFERAGL